MSYSFADSLRAGSGRNQFRPDDGQKNCPKHVEFYSKNKFEKLVHLVGFIIRTMFTSVKDKQLLPLRLQTANPVLGK